MKIAITSIAVLATLVLVGAENATRLEKNSRIFGGKHADMGDIPYIATIHVSSENKSVLSCSGAIISKTVILTSGVCASMCNKFECSVFVGRTSANIGGHELTIKETILHDSWTTLSVQMKLSQYYNAFKELMYVTQIPMNKLHRDQLHIDNDDSPLNEVIDLGMLRVNEIPLSKNIAIINLPKRDLISTTNVIISGYDVRSDEV